MYDTSVLMTLQLWRKNAKLVMYLIWSSNIVFNYLVIIYPNKIWLIINDEYIVIHSRTSQPDSLWTVELGKGGSECPPEANFCYLRGRAPRCLVQSSLILNVLTRKSSLLRPEDKQKNINAATWQSLKAAMWQIKAKSGHILSTQVTNW